MSAGCHSCQPTAAMSCGTGMLTPLVAALPPAEAATLFPTLFAPTPAALPAPEVALLAMARRLAGDPAAAAPSTTTVCALLIPPAPAPALKVAVTAGSGQQDVACALRTAFWACVLGARRGSFGRFASVAAPHTPLAQRLRTLVAELNVTLPHTPLTIAADAAAPTAVAVQGAPVALERLEHRALCLPGVASSLCTIPLIPFLPTAVDPVAWFAAQIADACSDGSSPAAIEATISVTPLGVPLPQQKAPLFIFEASQAQPKPLTADDADSETVDVAALLGVSRDLNTIFDTCPETIVDCIKHRVATIPNETAFVWLTEGETVSDTITFAELWQRGAAVAVALQEKQMRGKPALLLFSPDDGPCNIAAVWGCLLSGTVAVPVAPPDPKDIPASLQRIGAVVRDCGCTTVLSTSTIAGMLGKLAATNPLLRAFTVIPIDIVLKAPQRASEYVEPPRRRDDLAILQFSSGSTGVPKGVMLTHRSMLFDAFKVLNALGIYDRLHACAWLPLYFDMGLLPFAIYVVCAGVQVWMFSPVAFLKKPFRWIKAISDYKVEVTGAPNFAFEQCTMSITDEMMQGLDLSSCKVVFSGSESVRAQTLAAFSAKFGKFGFPAHSLMPVYGLAEATLLVAGTPKGSAPTIVDFDADELEHGKVVPREPSPSAPGATRQMTSCGFSSSGPLFPIRIVDPATLEPSPDAHIGEIWVSGPTRAAGYWNKPEVSEATFRAHMKSGSDAHRPFLRTGDLGFIHNDHLFISGRAKDLIIINGRNHSPIDIETTVEHHPSVLKANSAAFSVEMRDTERLVVVAEPSDSFNVEEAQQAIAQIRQLIQERHEVPLHAIAFIKQGTICKTDTGKIQRSKCKEMFVKKELQVLVQWSVDDAQKQQKAAAAGTTAQQQQQQQQKRPLSTRAQAIADALVKSMSGRLGAGAADVQLQVPFSAYGLGSAAILGLAGELETLLGTKIQPTIFYEFPTIELLARHLAGDDDDEAAQLTDAPSPATDNSEPIAIVGISCRFPGAANKDAFWELLVAGRDAISEVPATRFDANKFFSETPRVPGKMYVRHGGFVDDIDLFDNAFFGISRAEAASMDPQQRLLLMCTQEAFDDAGEATGALAGSRTAVAIGICSTEYASMQMHDTAISGAFVATGGAASIASNRISYAFDLQGPSVTVDTACSSSLVALDIAARYIHQGVCDRAVVGGANLILSPQTTIALCQASFLAPDGRCKTFDANADGFTRSEGVAVVIVKPLSKARAAGDRIYAAIAATAVNQDGQSNGLTAPNPRSQQLLLREACRRANIEPAAVQYVECHGTGTALGDPIEVQSLNAVMRAGRDPAKPLLIGSAKSNIGHAEACAGMAGLIKLALAMHNKQIPPSIHFHTPNPKIGFENLTVRVVDKLTAWPEAKQLVGGVSSFGFGGTNAHALLVSGDESNSTTEQPDPTTTTTTTTWTLCLSAATENTLRATISQYARWMSSASSPSIAQICHTALARRSPNKHRAAFIGASKEELVMHMKAWLMGKVGEESKQHVVVAKTIRQPNKVCFVFCGQGAQWLGMGQELYMTNAWFREQCAGWVARFAKLGLDYDLRAELGAMTAESSHLDQTKVAQIFVFIYQICTARLLERSGVRCSAVIGHSLGEISAACFAGIIDDDTAAKIVRERAYLMQQTHGKGKMCAIQLSAADIAPFVAPFADCLSLACINAPNSVVLSGDEETLGKCVAAITAAKPTCSTKMLPVNYVFHSPQLDFAVPQLEEKLADMKPSTEGRMRMFSTETGSAISGVDLNARYWAWQLRKPVLFDAAVSTAIKDGHHALVEIGPHPVLNLYMRTTMDAVGVEGVVLPTCIRRSSETVALSLAVARLWAAGCAADPLEMMFASSNGGNEGAADAKPAQSMFAELPPRIWEAQSHWMANPPAFNTQNVVPSARLEDCLYETRWEEAALSPVASAAATPLVPLVFADDGAKPFSIGQMLRAAVGDSIVVPLGSDITAAATLGKERGCNAVVYCWANAVASATDWALPVTGLVQLAQALARAGYAGIPVVVVTSCSMTANPVQAMAWGIARTMANEYPTLLPTIVDVATAADVPALAAELRALVARPAASEETCVMLRDGKRFVPRVRHLSTPPATTWVDTLPVSSDGVYLITGGLGGLGLETAEWLCSKGCKRLVLLDKRAASESTEARLASLRAKAAGCDIRVVVMALEDRAALEKLFAEIGSSNLRGVFHFAGTLSRAPFAQLTTPDLVGEAVSAKVVGAQHLHELTAALPQLELFVMTSSVSTLVPHVGQGAYSASNCFLDALAQKRRAMGLPAISVGIGLLAGVGMIATQTAANIDRLRSAGLFATPAADILRVMAHFHQLGCSALFARIDWEKYAPAAPIFSSVRKHRVAAAEAAVSKDVDDTATATTMVERSEQEIVDWLVNRFAEALSISVRELDINAPLSNYGLQSVTVIDVTAQLSQWLGVKVSPNIVYDFPTIASLAKHLAGICKPSESTKKAAAATTMSRALVATSASSQKGPEPIAIIGMACKFPGGSNGLAAYWNLLLQGRDAVTEVPPTRFDVNAFFDPDIHKRNKINSKCGGFVDGIDMFDAEFWSISPREAERLDPQQRMCLEMAWEALEDAGLAPSKLAGGRHGVFVGLSVSEYGQQELLDGDVSDAYFATGSFICMNANRLSYLLDFQGPSVALDTACSSTTVAMHLACNALRNGECGLSLTGGVNAILSPMGALTLTKTGALSPEGRCFTFDARADGYVRSEGCGMVVLKPMKAAIADGDRIYCVIAGSSVNQDGKSQGLTAPNGQAQQALLEDAYHRAQRSLGDVTYIECHGTGTKLGDHIEVASLGQVLLRHRRVDNKVLIGSVKTNLGHLECASGAASVIKAALALRNSFIPPSIHFQTPNPHIDFAALPVAVCAQGVAWPAGRPKLAGVSSFGFGGTNAHIVLEAAPDECALASASTAQQGGECQPTVLAFSARTAPALAATAARLAEFLKAPSRPALRDISFSLLCRHEHHRLRAAVVCGGAGMTEQQACNAACEELLAFAASPPLVPSPQSAAKVAFVFTGQGPQHWGMARQLYATEPSFRAAIDSVDALFRTLPDGFSAAAEINNPEEKNSRLGETICAQRVLFAIQYALAQLYQSRGVTPSVVLGHSLGEVAAACVAGILELADAVRLIHARSEVMNRATGLGRMLALMLPADKCIALAAECAAQKDVSLAAENSAKSCVLSGATEALERIATRAAAQGVQCRFLPVNYAFHSPQMTPFAAELREKVRALGLRAHEPRVAMISTMTAAAVRGEELAGAEYWAAQVCKPVSFRGAVAAALGAHLADVFVELSPHPVLSRNVREVVEERGLADDCGQTCAMRRDSEDERATFLSSLVVLHQWRVAVDWHSLFFASPSSSQLPPVFVATPSYAWQKQRYWLQYSGQGGLFSPLLCRTPSPAISPALSGPAPILDTKVADVTGGETLSWIAHVVKPGPLEWEFDHRGFGSVLVPGVTYLEASLEASLRLNGPGLHVLSDIQFHKPLFLSASQQQATLHTVLLNTSQYVSTVVVKSATEPSTPSEKPIWLQHASVKVHKSREQFVGSASDPISAEPPADVAAILQRCSAHVDGSTYYDGLWTRGLQLGPAFRSIRALNVGDGEVLAELQPPEHLHIEDYVFHPCVLDAIMQCLGAFLLQRGMAQEIRGIFLPSHIDMLKCWSSPPRASFYVHVKTHQGTKKAIAGDIHAFTREGTSLLRIYNFRCNYVEDSRGSDDVYFEQQWQLLDGHRPSPDTPLRPTTTLVFADTRGIGSTVAEMCRAAEHEATVANYTPSLEATGAFVTTSLSTGASDGRRLNVVFAWPADVRDQDELPQRSLLPFSAIIRAIGGLPLSAPVNLWIVTTDAKCVNPGEGRAAWQAAIWGMAGIAAHECPQIRVFLADLSADPTKEELSNLAAEIASNGASGDDQLCFRADRVFSCRLAQAAVPSASKVVRASLCDMPCRAEIGKAGSVDSLCLRACPRRAPAADEVEVEVRAGSINFRDVMRSLGLYPGEDDSPALGLEAAGIVTRVGSSVSEFRVGDEVIAISNGSLGTHVVSPARFCVRKPRGFTCEQAAALTGVMMTAYAGLVWTAQLSRGERVLVHLASGGVGLAALQICKQFGCEVFATAGRKEKREYLVREMGIPADHVFSSRDVRFADAVLRLTGGKGVDVVLNSLAGEGLLRSYELLAYGGRFIEIGKRDIFNNTQLGMRVFSRCTTFASVAIDELFNRFPDRASRLLREVVGKMDDGTFVPVPTTCFALTEVTQAFRFVASAAHVGKVVLTVDAAKQTEADIVVSHPQTLRRDGTYLVTGALGGMGVHLCEWLLRHGAGTVLALTRNPDDAAVAADRERLDAAAHKSGAKLIVAACDVAKEADLADILSRHVTAAAPLRGVFHAAGVLDDKLLVDVTAESLQKVLLPKVAGASNLHEQTKRITTVEIFALFSSVSSLMGMVGQSAYAAANAFLDGLATLRKAEGLPAVSLNWGPLRLGMTARQGAGVVSAMEEQGLTLFEHSDYILHLSRVVFAADSEHMPPQLALIKIDWSKWASSGSGSLTMARTKRFSGLARSAGAQTVSGRRFLRELFALPPKGPQRLSLVTSRVAAVVASVLSLPLERVDTARPLSEAGLDSMVANEVRVKLEQDLGVPVSVASLIGGPPISKVAAALLMQLEALGAHSSEAEHNGSDVAVAQMSLAVELATGQSPAVVAVCPAGGQATIFGPLAARLGRRFFGLQKTAVPCAGLRELAAAHVRSVRSSLPGSGPITVLGHSLGAAVGYELAQQLVAAGVKVNSLVLLDPVSPDTQRLLPARGTLRAAMLLFAMGRGNANPDALASALHWDTDKKAADINEAQLWKRFFETTRVPPAEQSAHKLAIWEIAEEISMFARYTWSAGDVTFPVVMVRAADNHPRAIEVLQTNTAPTTWEKLINTQVATFETPGDHWTMLSTPGNVTTLAGIVSNVLRKYSSQH